MPQLIERQELAWQAALTAAKAAMSKADELKIKIHVAVVDAAGLELVYLRHNGAFLHSAQIARDKAYTSASFGVPTGKWPEVLEADPALKLGFPHQKRFIVFGGGFPIKYQDTLLGGIGVSGGSAEQDEACALAGLDAINI